MSTARTGAQAGNPIVVDVRSLPPLTVAVPPAVRSHDAGHAEIELPESGSFLEHREPTFDELVHGYGRHRADLGAASAGGSRRRGPARRAAGRRS